VKPWQKWALTTLGVAIVSFGLTRVLWPDPPDASGPPGGLLPLFIVLGVLESLAFGLGVSFLIFGGGLLARLRQSRALTVGAYLSTAWLLINWWPHDNLHRITGHGDWAGLAAIEYGFHVTLIAAGATLAVFLVSTMNALTRAQA
jgi:hypothetical protein